MDLAPHALCAPQSLPGPPSHFSSSSSILPFIPDDGVRVFIQLDSYENSPSDITLTLSLINQSQSPALADPATSTPTLPPADPATLTVATIPNVSPPLIQR